MTLSPQNPPREREGLPVTPRLAGDAHASRLVNIMVPAAVGSPRLPAHCGAVPAPAAQRPPASPSGSVPARSPAQGWLGRLPTSRQQGSLVGARGHTRDLTQKPFPQVPPGPGLGGHAAVGAVAAAPLGRLGPSPFPGGRGQAKPLSNRHAARVKAVGREWPQHPNSSEAQISARGDSGTAPHCRMGLIRETEQK